MKSESGEERSASFRGEQSGFLGPFKILGGWVPLELAKGNHVASGE